MISFYGQSYVGRRKNNQDSILTLCINKEKTIYFFAAADGMGGAAGGEVASKIAIDICRESLTEYFSENDDKPDLKHALTKAIMNADKAILKKVKKDNSLNGMGTTLTGVLIYGDKYIIGNIGDSRTYIYDESIIKQTTIDHSIIQEYREKYGDEVDPAILKNYGHGVTKVLQGHGDEPDIFPKEKGYFKLKVNTGFMLCSEGLLVDKSENDPSIFQKLCINSKKLKDNVEQLISYAFYNGSTDNISIICIEYGKVKKHKQSLPKYPYPPKEKLQKKNKPDKKIMFTIPIVMLIIILAVILLNNKNESLSNTSKTQQVNISHNTPEPEENTTLSFKNGGFFPQFGSYPHNFKQEGHLNLSWQTDPINVKDVVYQIYLSENPDVNNPIILSTDINKITIKPSDIPKQITEGILYWQLHAIIENQEIAVSEVQKIKIKK